MPRLFRIGELLLCVDLVLSAKGIEALALVAQLHVGELSVGLHDLGEVVVQRAERLLRTLLLVA